MFRWQNDSRNQAYRFTTRSCNRFDSSVQIASTFSMADSWRCEPCCGPAAKPVSIAICTNAAVTRITTSCSRTSCCTCWKSIRPEFAITGHRRLALLNANRVDAIGMTAECSVSKKPGTRSLNINSRVVCPKAGMSKNTTSSSSHHPKMSARLWATVGPTVCIPTRAKRSNGWPDAWQPGDRTPC